jgi:hypothetical protein
VDGTGKQQQQVQQQSEQRQRPAEQQSARGNILAHTHSCTFMHSQKQTHTHRYAFNSSQQQTAVLNPTGTHANFHYAPQAAADGGLTHG